MLIGAMAGYNNTRLSDLDAQFPTIQYEESHNNSWYNIDGETIDVHLLESRISMISYDGYCNITVTFANAMNTPKMTLYYGYDTLPGKPVPVKPTSTGNDQERSSWVDPFTGHGITLWFKNTAVVKATYDGTTFLKGKDGLHTVDFHLEVNYDTKGISYIQKICNLPTPSHTHIDVIGVVDNKNTTGTVEIEPRSCIRNIGSSGSPTGNITTIMVSITLPDANLPGLPNEFQITLRSDGSFNKTFQGYSKITENSSKHVTYSITIQDGVFSIYGSIESLSIHSDNTVSSDYVYHANISGAI